MSITSATPAVPERLRRLGRLTLKELRELLRDRRTIVTLVLMPLLLYPLLTVAFQQFFVTQLGAVQTPRYTVGFQDGSDAQYLIPLLREGGLVVLDIDKEPAEGSGSLPRVQAGVRQELDLGLSEY